LDAALGDQAGTRTLLYRLLEELPVAVLISGYAALYEDRSLSQAVAGDRSGGTHAEGRGDRVLPRMPTDVCAGWVAEGVMMRGIERHGEVPIPVGPAAPALDPDDAEAWHPMAALAPGGMRRRRLVDVRSDPSGGGVAVHAMFRDSHVGPDGVETVLHQYDVDALVDPVGATFRRCRATPRALPWPECPGAAASAERLVGRRVDEVPGLVRHDLRGTSTCTHLNDLLRSLGDVGVLMAALAAGAPQLPV
jgi:hypothetical protein